jgi:DNA-binding NarL/FixJ family response regulator
MKILIVDDHAAFRQVVKNLVQAAGAECLECENGVQAVAQYPQFRPDLVLMDIAMKGLDGLSATAEIAARFLDARVVMLTEYDDPDLRAAAREAGARGYLLKEDLSQLQALLQAAPVSPA